VCRYMDIDIHRHACRREAASGAAACEAVVSLHVAVMSPRSGLPTALLVSVMVSAASPRWLSAGH